LFWVNCRGLQIDEIFVRASPPLSPVLFFEGFVFGRWFSGRLSMLGRCTSGWLMNHINLKGEKKKNVRN